MKLLIVFKRLFDQHFKKVNFSYVILTCIIEKSFSLIFQYKFSYNISTHFDFLLYFYIFMA